MGIETVAAVALAASAATTIYSVTQQRKAASAQADAANRAAQMATPTAPPQSTQAPAQAQARATPREGAQGGRTGGRSGAPTLLTGSGGVPTSELNLGRNTLLGQ